VTTTEVRRRYGRIARIYDVANLEWLLYAAARERAIDMLQLQPGSRVLDVACGTGANFALIEKRIGPSGELVGVDLTPAMLARAGARVRGHGWENVKLLEANICAPPDHRLRDPFDAILCTLALSVIPDWRHAWDAMLTLARPGGRVGVMDAGIPEPGGPTVIPRSVARPLERLFAADCRRRPWRLLQRDTGNPVTETFTWGWVTAAGGVKAAT
jgi:ubiquinone/menaquinone biosynthesis C-methylase UbiE